MDRAELTAILAGLFSLRRPGSVNKMVDKDIDTCVGEAMRIIDRVDEFLRLSPEDLAKRLAGKSHEAIGKDNTNMKIPEGAIDDAP